MTLLPGVVVAVSLLVGLDRPAQTSQALGSVRALYAAAAYEEALARLRAIEANEDPIVVAQLRALCLLGLGETERAERALETLVWRDPSYGLGDADVSPRLVAMFADVRDRLLPSVASSLLSNARTLYENGQLGRATEQLEELIRLIDAEPQRTRDGSVDLTDVRVLASGFKELIAAELAAASDAPEPPIYSRADRDVVSPVEVSRPIPLWTPPRGSVPIATYYGLLEVVINEQGRVESPIMRRPVHDTYDPLLIDATTSWRFDPALKDGVPVRYRRQFEIIVHPRRGAGAGGTPVRHR
jgi:tetratricopeptide (TPR) repeat protein